MLVVTSSLPGEGKTTTAINIALALAEAEHNVVLVDGDMRRPKLDEYLDLVGSVGFSTVLSGQASLEEVLQKTRFPGLTVLTSGAVPPNPSELLGSLAAKKVLSELRAGFDYVIVDSSPLLAVTDAAILAADSDGVLMIARFAKTKREQLAHAVGNLKNVGARILGAVFTMTPARGSASYSYSYSYYGNDSARRPSRRRTAHRAIHAGFSTAHHGRRAAGQQQAQDVRRPNEPVSVEAKKSHKAPMTKRALITGITGQDGSYLAELLLAQGLRGARADPPRVDLQHVAYRPSVRRPAFARRADCSCTTAISATVRGW